MDAEIYTTEYIMNNKWIWVASFITAIALTFAF